ncbi:MAG: TonB-dependent receptor, partial [Ginsengibacter sp.]
MTTCTRVLGQNEIKGKVTDAITNLPLRGATIVGLHKNIQTISDERGQFHLPETDTILVSSTGYVSKKVVSTGPELMITLSPVFSNLSEVIISGSREKQKRTEVPVAINVITKTQINDTKATRLDMLINKVPGVFMVDLGNEQHSMSVRQPLGYNSLFLYLEDGIPIRTTGDFNHNGLIEINQSAVERIEVIKGPASSLYGSEAVGGAINFITKSPSPEFDGKVQAETSTRGYKKIDVSISNTHKKLGYYLGGNYVNQHQKISEHNDFNKTAITFRTDYMINKKSNLVTVADYIHYNTDQKGGLDSAHFYNKNYSSFYRFTYRKVDAFRVRNTFNREWNEDNKTSFTLYYRNTSIGQNPFYSIANIPGTNLAKGQINKDAFNSFGSVIQHSKNMKAIRLKWITGFTLDYSPATYLAHYIIVNKDAEGAYDQYQNTDSILTDYTVDLLNTAIYTQLQWNPIDRLRFVLAVRYDRLDYHFDNHLLPGAYTGAPDASNHFDQLTPKLGLTYDFGKNKGIYLNYSVGFAPPNINDLYSGVKVPTLQSSNYKNYEVGGWVAFAQNRVYAEISFYRLNGNNEIVNVRRDDGSYQNENAGITSHKGIELNVKYQPVQELSFRVGGTVAKHRFVEYNLQGKNYSGNEMPQSPSYIMNGEVTYKPLALQGFRISMEGQSVGNYFTDPQNTSKYNGFTVWNARMGYEIKKVEAWVNVINFLNNNYAVTVEKSGYGTSYRPGQLCTINVG